MEGLVGHAVDAADHNLPLMYWYAAEPLAGIDPSRAARLASASKIPLILQFMARRIGAIGTRESLALLVDELGRAPRSAERSSLLTGIEESLRGRRQVAMPTAWPDVFQKLAADPDRRVRSRAMALGVTFGDTAARAALRLILADGNAPLDPRREALAALLQVKDPTLAGHFAEPGPRPGARRSGRSGTVGIRRSGDAGCVDHGVHVARADRATRCLEHAGCSQGIGTSVAGCCRSWASCLAAI